MALRWRVLCTTKSRDFFRYRFIRLPINSSSPVLPFELRHPSPYLRATDLSLKRLFRGLVSLVVFGPRRRVQDLDFKDLERPPAFLGPLVVDRFAAGARLVADDKRRDVLVRDGRAVGVRDLRVVYRRRRAGCEGEVGHADEVAVGACKVGQGAGLCQWHVI